MPYRELDQGIYHVYNRGFEKMRIFECDQDYVRFLQRLEYLLQPPILNPGIKEPKSRDFSGLHLISPEYNENMTTQTIYTREELVALTDESIKKGHRALENALKKHSHEL